MAKRLLKLVLYAVATLLGLFAVLVVVALVSPRPAARASSSAPASPAPKIAATVAVVPVASPLPAVSAPLAAPTLKCVLRAPGADVLPLFPTEAGLDEWTTAMVKDDNAASVVAYNANGAIGLDAGARCTRLETRLMVTKVRVLDGPHAGASGWVPNEWTNP
jgi:hypothetical protein